MAARRIEFGLVEFARPRAGCTGAGLPPASGAVPTLRDPEEGDPAMYRPQRIALSAGLALVSKRSGLRCCQDDEKLTDQHADWHFYLALRDGAIRAAGLVTSEEPKCFQGLLRDTTIYSRESPAWEELGPDWWFKWPDWNANATYRDHPARPFAINVHVQRGDVERVFPQAARPVTTAKSESAARDYLASLPPSPRRRKREVLAELSDRFGLCGRAAKRVWAAAAHVDWKVGGAPRKQTVSENPYGR